MQVLAANKGCESLEHALANDDLLDPAAELLADDGEDEALGPESGESVWDAGQDARQRRHNLVRFFLVEAHIFVDSRLTLRTVEGFEGERQRRADRVQDRPVFRFRQAAVRRGELRP